LLLTTGTCYLAGIGVAQDFDHAGQLFLKAATMDDPLLPAASSSSSSPAPPQPAPQPLTQASALAMLSKSPSGSRRGHVRAMALLGLMSEHGFVHSFPKSDRFCLEFYLASGRRGYVYAQRELGTLFSRPGADWRNDALAFEWFKRASDSGYNECQIQVGEMYESGLGVEWSEIKALEMYTLAASHGPTAARRDGWMLLGYLHRNGLTETGRDLRKAYEFFEKAAAAGHPEALLALGELHQYNGGGVESMKQFTAAGIQHDENKSKELFEKGTDSPAVVPLTD
jgi:uncharacterized protein